MGKKSKAKRQRLDKTIAKGHIMQLQQDDESSSDESDIANQDSNVLSEDDIIIACNVLQALGRNVELFKAKPMKALRTQIFPLLNIQKSAFFEAEDTKFSLGSDQKLLNEKSSMNILSKVVAYMVTAQGQKDFLSPSYKRFRRSMHPLVIATVTIIARPIYLTIT